MSIRVAITVLLTAAVFAVMALPSETAAFIPTPVGQQRVVYVTPDYALYSVLSTGSGKQRLTEGGPFTGGGVRAQVLPQVIDPPQFTWPTWSPDGTRFVASQTTQLPRRVLAGLALITPPAQGPTYLQTTGRGSLATVADGLPHYAQWAPDGKRLVYVAPNPDGTALDLSLTDLSGKSSGGIASGAPIYEAWSPDSGLVAVHHREQLFIRELDGNVVDLESSYRYRVPSFNSTSTHLAYVNDIGLDGLLVSRDLTTGKEQPMMNVPGAVAFAFSPADPKALAVAVTPGAGFAGYDRLELFDASTGEGRTLYDGKTYAFWWSPDGTKIALVGSNGDSFTWVVVDVGSGESRDLGGFFPTQDFTTYIQFFDQFALSHEVWSEDSSSIVFAGELKDRPQADALDRAWVLDATGAREPTALATALQAYFVPSGKELHR